MQSSFSLGHAGSSAYLCHILITTKSTTGTPTTPGVLNGRCPSSRRRRGRMPWLKGRSISTVPSIRSVCSEIAPHKSGSDEVVAPTTKSRIDASEKIVCMGADNAHAFAQRRRPASHYQSVRQHCPRKILHWDLDDEKHHLFASVVLGVCVGEC